MSWIEPRITEIKGNKMIIRYISVLFFKALTIAHDSPHYAAAFVREVRDGARSLAHLAERGRVVPEFGDTSIRELFVRCYRLIYHSPFSVMKSYFLHLPLILIISSL
jgi:plasmid stabilization system protein ParE